MIETDIMMASLVVLGYAFNISSRMFWTFRSEKDIWRWTYGMVSVFLIGIYFLFVMVMLSFITVSIVSQSILNIMNTVIVIIFLKS